MDNIFFNRNKLILLVKCFKLLKPLIQLTFNICYNKHNYAFIQISSILHILLITLDMQCLWINQSAAAADWDTEVVLLNWDFSFTCSSMIACCLETQRRKCIWCLCITRIKNPSYGNTETITVILGQKEQVWIRNVLLSLDLQINSSSGRFNLVIQIPRFMFYGWQWIAYVISFRHFSCYYLAETTTCINKWCCIERKMMVRYKYSYKQKW